MAAMFARTEETIAKRVVLSLGQGSLETGFPAVTVTLSADGNLRGESLGSRHLMKFGGSLPPAPELVELYQKWKLFYKLLGDRFRTCTQIKTQIEFEIEGPDITNFSVEEFGDLCEKLQGEINRWFNSQAFRPIDQKLRSAIDPKEEIRVIFETEDGLLRRLPWHLWNFFEDYPKAELALSVSEYGPVEAQSQTPSGSVRILAVLGNNAGIDLEIDRRLLETLPNVELVFLQEPQRWELDEHLWNEKGWDILFFAGHSQSEDQKGQIYINSTQSLTIAQLKHALKKAIARGLKLAIFNSCDGLGLARQLEDLHIPQMVVMREPVADRVAQEFLNYFLRAFSRGESFYLSVREAWEKLQRLEDEFPCASWLPVICQNPATVPPTWQQLRGREHHRLEIPLIASILMTFLILGLRSSEPFLFQSWELKEFDRLIRLRPVEEADERVLVVEATEADIQKYGFPLPDGILAQAIENLTQHQPRTVALDILRDRPVEPGHDRFKQQLKQDDRLVAICSISETSNPNKSGAAPPPGLPPEQLGYSDIVVDADGILRRNLMFMQPNTTDPCATNQSLSARTALKYLAAEGIEPKVLSKNEVQIGNAVFTRVLNGWGAYQDIDDGGFQVMLNYRSQVAPRVSLAEVLGGQVNPDWIDDRIVLIGVSAPISSDYLFTPYSAGDWPYSKMPGVVIQAQAVSQILSAVLDDRPLLWTWSPWQEGIWIWGWSVMGGLVACRFGRISSCTLGTIAMMGMLYGVGWILFLQGGWVPLMPSALGLLGTKGIVFAYKVGRKRWRC